MDEKHGAPPPLEVRQAGPRGRGVFARVPFRKGERVLEFAGPLIEEETIEDFTYTIQVDHGLYVGPSGGIDDRVNHACEPSTHLRSEPPRLWLVAARDIRPGEEITFDYATCAGEEPTLQTCHCGSARCRGRVGTFWDLPPALAARYRRAGAVPRHVLEGPGAPDGMTSAGASRQAEPDRRGE